MKTPPAAPPLTAGCSGNYYISSQVFGSGIDFWGSLTVSPGGPAQTRNAKSAGICTSDGPDLCFTVYQRRDKFLPYSNFPKMYNAQNYHFCINIYIMKWFALIYFEGPLRNMILATTGLQAESFIQSIHLFIQVNILKKSFQNWIFVSRKR